MVQWTEKYILVTIQFIGNKTYIVFTLNKRNGKSNLPKVWFYVVCFQASLENILYINCLSASLRKYCTCLARFSFNCRKVVASHYYALWLAQRTGALCPLNEKLNQNFYKNGDTFESKFTRHVSVFQRACSVESRINLELHWNL